MAEEEFIKTDAFSKKRDLEWRKLRQQLHIQLQQDIGRIFFKSLYCDLKVNFGSSSFYTHKGILETRAKKFFTKFCSNSSEVCFLSSSAAVHVESFISNLYTKENVEEDENHVIALLDSCQSSHKTSVFHNVCDSELTPDSEIFVTPRTSPSDILPTIDVLPDVLPELHNINRSYYSIVPIDLPEELWRTVLDSPKKRYSTENCLEKELAEQDELIKSFESIKSKEDTRKSKKIVKPTSLPIISSPFTKRKKPICDKYCNDKGVRKDIKVPERTQSIPSSSHLDILVEEKFTESKKTSSVVNQKESFDYICNYFCDIGKYEHRISHCELLRKCENDLDHIISNNTVLEIGSCKEVCLVTAEEFLSLPCSPEMDGSAAGPDSGIDTCSTSYVPGGGLNSPREQTVSETSGVDLTGDDMPQDEECEKQISCTSSPVNSEICTWDTAYPSMQYCENNEHNVQCDYLSSDNQTPKIFNEASFLETKKPLHEDDDWCEIENGMLSLNIPTENVEHFIQSGVKTTNVNKVPDSLNFCNSESYSSDKKMESSNNFFINAADLSDENEYSLPPVMPSLEEIKPDASVLKTNAENYEMLAQSERDIVSDRPKCDIVTKGLPDFICRSNTTLNDLPSPASQAEVFSEDMISLLTPNPTIQGIRDQFTENCFRTRSASESVSSKMTPLQASVLRVESKYSSSEDHMEKLEKEIQVTEHLEPFRECRKVTVVKQKCDSGFVNTSINESTVNSTECENKNERKLTKLEEKEQLNVILKNVSEAKTQESMQLSDEINNKHNHVYGTSDVITDKTDLELYNTSSSKSTTENNSDAFSSENRLVDSFNKSSKNDVTENSQDHCVKNVSEDASFSQTDSDNLLMLPVDNSSSTSSSHPDSQHSLESDSKHETETSEVSGEEDVPRRASLIRRNTFELDPDDDKLALLRQEYEKRQGNLLFKNCIPQFSGHIVEDSLQDCANRDALQPMSLPNISSQPLNGPSKSPHLLPHLINQELDTPDSLNNDLCMENMFVENVNFNNDFKIDLHNDEIICKDHNLVNGGTDNTSRQSLQNSNENIDEKVVKKVVNSYDNSHRPVVSGALTCDDIQVNEKKYDSLKKQKRTESTPIVSGGVIASDFVASINVKKDSPIMSRRKNEMAPIVSGGATIEISEQPKVELQVKESSTVNSAWVVDMSDCSPSNTRSPSDLRRRRRTDSSHCESISPSKQEASSLQFYIDLSEEHKEKSFSKDRKQQMNVKQKLQNSTGHVDLSKSESVLCDVTKEEVLRRKSTPHVDSSPCKFYVDLNEGASDTVKEDVKKESKLNDSKKNTMFSMFIDIGTDTEKTEKVSSLKDRYVMKKKLTSEKRSPSLAKRDFVTNLKDNSCSFKRSISIDDDDACKMSKSVNVSGNSINQSDISGITKSASHSDMKEITSQEKKAFYMFVETESPVPRRKTLPPGAKPVVNRHSWNSDAATQNNSQEQPRSRHEKFHKRAHSLSVDRNIILNCSDVSFTNNVTKTQTTKKSNHLPMHESVPQDRNNDTNHQGNDFSVKKVAKQSSSVSEEGSMSSIKQNSEENSTKLSTDSPTEKDLFTQESSSVTEEVKIPEDLIDNGSEEKINVENNSVNNSEAGLINGATEPSSAQVESSSPSFVKLSDLDKQVPKPSIDQSDDILTNFSNANRMTRSIPETSWIENKLLMSRSIGSTTSSKSLNRLFPHLHTASTTSSSPNSMARSKSPDGEDGDAQTSETSDLSSMQSSMGPSGLDGSTEETDASSSYMNRSGPVSRLGEDLLRMFLEEINPDVTVDVGGRKLKAHKCILSSRCQYFAAMLSGGWVESAGNVISLQGFSYNAVHFALCHIYSGTSNIPDTISIVELATLADMLGLEGLKEVIMYTLKVKYCHFFHKPCTMCAVGVVECLPLAAAYGLDEIYRKGLRWIMKHFVRIWPTKGFASLPRELIEKCYQQHVVHMTVENVLDTLMNCDKLLATLPNVRWAEPVLGITSQLLDASIKYLSNNFSGVMESETFMSLGKDMSWNISRLEDSLLAATDRLPPEQACQSYSHLYITLNSEPDIQHRWSQSYLELLRRLQKRVEANLIRQAPRAARCPSWSRLDPSVKKKIQEAACLVILPGEELQRMQQSKSNKQQHAQHSTGTRSSRSLDLRQVKLAMAQQARRLASGGHVSTLQADCRSARQSTHRKQKSEPAPVQKTTDKNDSIKKEEPLIRPKTWPMRVLESKARPHKQDSAQASATCTSDKCGSRRSGKTLISSSDSSRTSSPAMKRAGIGRNQMLSKTRKKPGDDTLSDKCSTKETSSVTTSKSCLSTRPETPSMRRKLKDETAISTDSLSEGAVNGDKAPSSAPGRILGNMHLASPPTKGRGRQPLGRLNVEGTMSSDSLANTDSSSVHADTKNKVDVKASTKSPKFSRSQNRTVSNENQHRSPSAKRAVMRQTACSPRDSPTAKLRTSTTSSVSPLLRRNMTVTMKSPTENVVSSGRMTKTNKTVSSPTTNSRRAPVKCQGRGQTPAKNIVESPKLSENRSPLVSRPATKNAGVCAKVGSLRKSAAPCPPAVNKAKNDGTQPTPSNSENKPPSVGSRSGTFLKDEPTVLKIPKIADVAE